jgi:anti-sigma factor RsiW
MKMKAIPVQCAESLRVQAYFDAQLDPLAADQVERHIEHCAECRAQLEDMREVRTQLREGLKFELAPAALRARVSAALDQEVRQAPPLQWRASKKPAKPFVWGALSGFGMAAAATLLGFALLPIRPDPVLDEMVDAHVRSLLPEHLIDVVSSERHTVKPWFAGHADVSPVVVDFEAQGYKLLGGRADYVEQQRAAVVVYQHGAHTINVFSWATDKAAAVQNATRNGYHLEFWKIGNLEYCAISDTGWEELHELVRLIKARE